MVTTAEKDSDIAKRLNDESEESKGASVFVGNLAYKTTWQSLKDYMGQAGVVNHATIFKDQSGRSKGCGLVEFKNNQAADKAIKELNNTVLDGREISVRPDEKADTREPKKPREFDSKRSEPRQIPTRGGYPRRDFAERPVREDRKAAAPGTELYVSNLSWDLNWQDLKDEFKKYGNVVRVDIVKDKFTGKSAGYGFVTFEESSEADLAIEKLNGKSLRGREINVKNSARNQGSPKKEKKTEEFAKLGE